MNRLAFLPLGVMLASCASEPAPDAASAAQAREEFRLRAKVVDVRLIGSPMLYGAPRDYMLTDFDADYAVAMRVISVRPPQPNFEKERIVIFAMHSFFPFYGQNPMGKTYDFIVRPPRKQARQPFWDLKVPNWPNQAMQPTASPRTASVLDD